VLTHGATGVRSEELHGSRVSSTSSNNDGVLHGAVLFELAHYSSDRALLLSDGNVDTLNASAFLVDDGVNRDGSFTYLTVADDQLTLATSDRYHRVDGFQTDLYRLRNGFTRNYTRCHFFNGVGQLSVDRAFAVDRVAERVDYAAFQCRSNRHLKDALGA